MFFGMKVSLMIKSNFIAASLAGLLSVSLVGCQNLPGTPQAQGAVIGGLGGATAGAAIGHNAVGTLLGGALGAGAGYVIGANKDKITGRDQASATHATQTAQARPATAQDVARSSTADLNGDGFVTLDEVAALRQAGLSDDQMLQRLQATHQIFELTPDQENYLRSQGVDNYVITQMGTINRAQRQQLLNGPVGGVANPPSSVISVPPPR